MFCSLSSGSLIFESLEGEFTPSVRVEIGQVRETETSARQGELKDMELPQNIAEVHPGAEARDIASQKTGFAKALSVEIGNRRGQKTHGPLPENIPEVPRAATAGQREDMQ